MGKLSVLTGKINDIETDLYPVTIPQGVIDPSDKKPLSDDLPKIKDKVYDSANYSGLGRVYLEKNIVSDVNILTQYMISQNNTIYIVEWDFDLNGSEISIPDGCILEFKGGSFSNGTIVGNKTKLSGNLTYSIFNDCEIKGFNIGYVDVRWFGGIPDYDSSTGTGTDNAIAFDRAIKTCGKHMGAYVKVVGKYVISSTINVKYDLNLAGDYHVGRSFWTPSSDDYVDTDVVEEGCNSLIYVPDGVTAFNVVGRGLQNRKTANLNINNIRFVGGGTDNETILIDFNTTGAPPRVGKFIECRCTGFNKVLYFHDLGLFADGTIYGGLIIARVVAYANKQFIVAKASGDLVPTLCNLKITDSNIEQNGNNAIYLENLFGPNVIENCLLENSPNVINTTIINGSLDIRNNYFEQQGGDYMVKVKGKAFSNCFVSCVNNYRVNADVGKPFIFNTVTITEFDTVRHNISDFDIDGSIVKPNLYDFLTTDVFSNTLSIIPINYYKHSPYDDYAHDLAFGSERLAYGVLGTKSVEANTSKSFEITKCSVESGDSLLICFYTTGGTFSAMLTDADGAPLSDNKPVLYGSRAKMKLIKFTINKAAESVYFRITPQSDGIHFGNGIVYKNIENISLADIGIADANYKSMQTSIEYQTASGLSGLMYISNRVFDGLFYSEGSNIRNSDGSLFAKVEIVSKYTDYVTFTKSNTIYKIVGDLDMNGQTVTIGEGCILDFSLGGTISNGTINLNETLLYPQCLTPSNYITATLKGFFKDGQVIYNSTEGKLKLMHNGNWVNLDGSAIN